MKKQNYLKARLVNAFANEITKHGMHNYAYITDADTRQFVEMKHFDKLWDITVSFAIKAEQYGYNEFAKTIQERFHFDTEGNYQFTVGDYLKMRALAN